MEFAVELDDDPDILRYRQRRSAYYRRRLLFMVGGTALLGIVTAIAVYATWKKRTEPVVVEPAGRLKNGRATTTLPQPSANETENMTYLGLLEVMRKRGLKVNMASSDGVQLYVFDADEEATRDIALSYTGERMAYGNFVACTKHKSPQAAKEYVESAESGRFQWGHFSFTAKDLPHIHPEAYFKLRKSLLGY